jgi:hypothetical protein
VDGCFVKVGDASRFATHRSAAPTSAPSFIAAKSLLPALAEPIYFMFVCSTGARD